MTVYAAFLRGVMNLKMSELVRAYERAGFEDVATVAASGNVVFRAKGSESAVEKRADAATRFMAFVRPIAELEALLAKDPFARFDVPRDARRVITFLKKPPKPAPRLPVELEGARIYKLAGREALTAYVRQPGNPVFMTLIARTFGKDQTTRTWDAIEKTVARARRG